MEENFDFDINFNNLQTDINSVELILDSIQKHIVILESQISHIQNIIKNPNTQSSDKPKLYNSLNNGQEMLSKYYDNYNKYLETRYKYRKEQNELKLKTIKLETEVSSGVKSNTELSDMLKQFSNYKSNFTEDLDSDPLYTI